MKYFIKIFGPPMRRLEGGGAFSLLVWAVSVVLVAAAMVSSVPRVLNRAHGWQRTTAVVIKAGVKPLENDQNRKAEAETRSVVKFSVRGQPRVKTFSLNWFNRDGSHIHVWTRGQEATSDNPSRLRKLIGRPILWTIFALLATLLVAGILAFLRDRVKNYDKKVAEEITRAERAEQKRQQEANELKEAETIVQTALEHGNVLLNTSDWKSLERLRRHCPDLKEALVLQDLVPVLGKSSAASDLLIQKLLELEHIKIPGHIDQKQWGAAVSNLTATAQ